MTRFVMIRDGEQSGERMVEESAVPTEAALHEVLMHHPTLVPATDLGFGRVVTVGFEASLSSGSADLVLLDEEGRVCIVEVKKEGNPDTRRVIAQLLDYASALWGLTVDEFERDVLRRTLGDERRGLREFVLDELVAEAESPDDAAEETLVGLAETLRAGDFTLVLAAPTIPAGVQRVIEYLNARGSSVFGLEISYFAGEVEVFVPRVVVRPSVGGPGPPPGPKPSIDRETYLASLPDEVQEPVSRFLDDIGGFGGELQWRHYGARVRVEGAAGPRVIVYLYEHHLWLAVGSIAGLRPEPGARAARRLSQLAGGKAGETYATFRWATRGEQVETALEIVRDFVREFGSS